MRVAPRPIRGPAGFAAAQQPWQDEGSEGLGDRVTVPWIKSCHVRVRRSAALRQSLFRPIISADARDALFQAESAGVEHQVIVERRCNVGVEVLADEGLTLGFRFQDTDLGGFYGYVKIISDLLGPERLRRDESEPDCFLAWAG
jgi:hypothetical protein